MASRSETLDAFLAYDFDKSYFDAMDADDADDDIDDDNWWGSECDSEDEAKFDSVNPLVGEMFAYMQRHYDKQPMRDSILTGQGYMDELDNNPNKCFEMFHMTRPYLLHLVDELIGHGYLKEGQGDVDATQAVAMLLYILGHNTRMRCVTNRFQHSIETVSRHFRRVLQALHSYARHLIKPDPDVVCLPEHLWVNKYYPWFENCVGAMDGTHVSVRPPKHVTQAYKSRKVTVTTNVLCVCNMDMQFIYVHAGWEGSTNDSRVFEEAIGDPKHGFPWPPMGSYYLVDSGLPIGTSFLPPHKSTRYHAQEFHSSNRTPITKKELFNYQHSSLQMVIERLFGVLKARFSILNLMPNFKRNRQCYVITTCCCLHNFMRINNRCDEFFNTWDNVEYEGNPIVLPGSGKNGASTSTANQRHVVEMSDAPKRRMTQFRDDITDAMWTDYVARRT